MRLRHRTISACIALAVAAGALAQPPSHGPAKGYLLITGGATESRDYQRLVATLRAAKIASELYLGEGKMNAQLKYADRRGSLCAVIQGSNEREAAGGPQVVIRDLALGAELAKANKDRADYLELRAKAQIAVAESELVDRVRQVIARGGAPLLG